MGYHSLSQCTADLEQQGELLRIDVPVDPHLEAAAIQRRVFAAGGPALLFTNVTGCRFPMVSNLFGTIERARTIFRDGLPAVSQLVAAKADPQAALRKPWKQWKLPLHALTMLPKYVRSGPVLANETTLSQLPQMQSWPEDGGPFITLPAVYSEDVRQPGLSSSNLGMYRVQLAGNEYAANREVGLHYQIHRSIGVHHQAAMAAGKPFRVNIFIGGPPALPLAAVMPLPEGMSELTFAGALNRRRVRMIRQQDVHGNPAPAIHAECDFCITGTVDPKRLLPEGPFGDHLGYYSLQHLFPVLQVEHVYHRDDAIWPFTVVGRPPQEDTMFGQLIHEMTGPLIPTVLPGVAGVHAVDAAGVHPLLLAIGSERYMPMSPASEPGNPAPQELLTQANAILGQGQLSLAKFLLIVNGQDDPQLNMQDETAFLRHLLARCDWRRDLHFQTATTIDTLDYSGDGLNAGSKVVMAAVGPARFELATEVPAGLSLPDGFRVPRVVMPGVLAIEGPPCPAPSFQFEVSPEVRQAARQETAATMQCFVDYFNADQPLNKFRWLVIVDDSQFVSESVRNFLWTVFTRTNPASDLYGIDATIVNKHWGCRGSLVFDARIKSHHAPPLEEDPSVTRRVEGLAAEGGPLHGIL
ncbi:UbiD family decarboxylase [Adhaeretor mobilis]|uniref:4-hydroxybenzoate decarboxylase subunit C n=1 Tax=Adhaeretor mobilis TaxID=1930276 RepID=A0A517MR84_9BACT|nr:UbiD family decarboxylase [Adhaeretor mobilis]QDS97386.1 4-hydroxybenzoate decarboxylase subunit C [Adhaeretor mobilis]